MPTKKKTTLAQDVFGAAANNIRRTQELRAEAEEVGAEQKRVRQNAQRAVTRLLGSTLTALIKLPQSADGLKFSYGHGPGYTADEIKITLKYGLAVKPEGHVRQKRDQTLNLYFDTDGWKGTFNDVRSETSQGNSSLRPSQSVKSFVAAEIGQWLSQVAPERQKAFARLAR